jgi:hypothetical protein
MMKYGDYLFSQGYYEQAKIKYDSVRNEKFGVICNEMKDYLSEKI